MAIDVDQHTRGRKSIAWQKKTKKKLSMTGRCGLSGARMRPVSAANRLLQSCSGSLPVITSIIGPYTNYAARCHAGQAADVLRNPERDAGTRLQLEVLSVVSVRWHFGDVGMTGVHCVHFWHSRDSAQSFRAEFARLVVQCCALQRLWLSGPAACPRGMFLPSASVTRPSASRTNRPTGWSLS